MAQWILRTVTQSCFLKKKWLVVVNQRKCKPGLLEMKKVLIDYLLYNFCPEFVYGHLCSLVIECTVYSVHKICWL